MHYRWRNRLVGVFMGVVAVVAASSWWPGLTFAGQFTAGVVGFVFGWFTDAWLGRTRYWYRRGTRGSWSFRCPSCDRGRWRSGEDLIPKCHNCGYKHGLPGVRWVWHSVFAQQFRRTAIRESTAAIVITAIIIVFAAGVTGTGLAPLDAATPSIPGPEKLSDGQEEPKMTTTPITATSTPTATPEPDETLSTSEAEAIAIQLSNDRREEHGKSQLSPSYTLSSVAREHSKDMANRDFYAHKNPDGEQPWDRANNVAECGNAVSENIHRGYLNERMRVYNSSQIIYTDDAESVARYIVQGWMNSPGHRTNLLSTRWDYIGVGIYFDSPEFYATAMFC